MHRYFLQNKFLDASSNRSGYKAMVDEKEMVLVLQNNKKFSNGNNFIVIDGENVVLLAYLVPTLPAWDRQRLLLQHSLQLKPCS